jgi:hypothetical protein
LIVPVLLRALGNARLRLTFYGLQKLHARVREARNGPAAEIEHFDVGISTISDNYIADALLAYVDGHEKYILQWHEQHVRADYVQADHHGKRYSRMSVNGDNLLNWRCATATRSRADPSGLCQPISLMSPSHVIPSR